MAEQAGNLTFGIIKPDAVRAGRTGAVLQRVLDAGFRIRAMKLIHLTRPEAEGFYEVHRERPFFGELTTFMSSGPSVVLALEKEGAVKAWRDLMGATDPAKADEDAPKSSPLHRRTPSTARLEENAQSSCLLLLAGFCRVN